jgi:oligopeptide transport system substrate-binding protein
VEIAFSSGDPETRLMFEALSAMWRANLGANVQLAGEEFRVLQQNRMLHKPDLFWNAWIADYPDPLTFLALPMNGSDQNYMLYDNPQYDAHMYAAMASADPQVRNAHYNAAEHLLDADAVVIPIYYYQTRHLVRSYVRGWQDNPEDNHLSRDLYLEMPGNPK